MRFDQIGEAQQLANRYEQLVRFCIEALRNGDAIITLHVVSPDGTTSATEIDIKSATILIWQMQKTVLDALQSLGVEPPVCEIAA